MIPTCAHSSPLPHRGSRNSIAAWPARSSRGASHHREDECLPRDEHAVLAGAGESGNARIARELLGSSPSSTATHPRPGRPRKRSYTNLVNRIGKVSPRRTVTGDSSICLRSVRPRMSVGVARPKPRARTVAREPFCIMQDRASSRRPCPGGSAMPAATPAFVGIDVAKAELVIAIRPSGDRWSVPNDDAGVYTLVTRLRQHAPALVVLEATGGYECAAVAALAAARLPLVVARATSPGHRPARQDRSDRRRDLGALCGARPPRASGTAR